MNQVQVEQKSYQMPPTDGITVAHFLTDRRRDRLSPGRLYRCEALRMNRESRHRSRSDEDRMLDEASEETFPASDPVSAEQRVIVGRVGKPSFSMVSYGGSEKETVMEGTDAAGNRMFGSSKRKGI